MKPLFLLALLTACNFAFAQAGRIDTTFNAFPGNTGYEDQFTAQPWMSYITTQPDGKILVGGIMYHYSNEDRYGLVRTNVDGTLDQSFTAAGLYSDIINVAVPRPDGKILIGGQFNGYGPEGWRVGLGLANADGSIAAGFNDGMTGIDGEQVCDIALLSDGSALFCGNFSQYTWSWGGAVFNGIGKINADGSGYTGFTPPASAVYSTFRTLAVLPDGKILVGGGTDFTGTGLMQCHLMRLNSDGTLDAELWGGTGAPEGEINDIVVMPNGQYYISGSFDQKIVRIDSDGSIDPAFNVVFGAFISPGGEPANVQTMLLQADGKIVMGGYFSDELGNVTSIGRLNTDGSRDNTFAIGKGTHGGEVNSLAMALDGTILAAGYFKVINQTGRSGLAKLDAANGSVIPGFAKVTGAGYSVGEIILRSDEKILITGDFGSYQEVYRNKIALLNQDGTLDTGFELEEALDILKHVAFQPDNKLLAFGMNYALNGSIGETVIMRFLPDGTADPSFSIDWTSDPGTLPTLNKFLPQNDGKIYIGGYFNSINGAPVTHIVRVFANGATDQSFNCTTDGAVSDILVLPDGKILVNGTFTICNGIPSNGLMKLNPDGTVDPTFSCNSITWYGRLRLQPDGKILVGGSGLGGLIRLNADGSVDNTFTFQTLNTIIDYQLQPDGKILIAGDVTEYDGTQVSDIARLLPNGDLDPTFFLANGMNSQPNSGSYFRLSTVNMQSDGKILIGGEFMEYDGVKRNFLARLKNDVQGFSDLAVTFSNVADINCNANGSATANCSGGTGPYQFLWNTGETTPTITPATGGVYLVTVTDALGGTGMAALLLDAPGTTGLDLNVNLISTAFRPGFGSTVWLNAFNDGCVPATGQLKLAFDPLLNFVSSNPAPSSISGDTLIWDFTALTHDSPWILPQIEFDLDVSAMISDSVHLAAILPLTGDIDPVNNIKTYISPVVNGYDPNIKSVYPVGKCDVGYVGPHQVLKYTVQFQNTGNSEAINVVVMDELDMDLDLNSLRIVGQSHEMRTEILPGNVVKFHFDNIHLADSTSNESESHGYVIFEVKPLPAWLPHNTDISNKANIFFDFNPAVVTNEVHNLIYQGNDLETFSCFEAGTDEIVQEDLLIWPNPTNGQITVDFRKELQNAELIVIDLQGKEVARKTVTNEASVTVDLSNLESGIYLVSVRDSNGKIIQRNRKISKTNG